jgi:hypothetical protein
VPTNNLIKDDTFRSIEIPLIFNATNAGIKFKTTTAYTGNAFFDAAVVAQGLGTQNLMLDNVYSANVTTTSGALTSLNKAGWVTSCTAANPSVCTIVGFTVAPNCFLTASSTAGNPGVSINAISSSSVSIYTFNTATGSAQASTPVNFSCQKVGNDYLASSANVYSQASANYSRRAYTPTFTGLGTVTAIDCYESRSGEFLDVDCKFTSGISTAVEARISLPSGLTSSPSGALRNVGKWDSSDFAATYFYTTPLVEPSVGYITVGQQTTAGGSLVKQNGNGFTSTGKVHSFTARVPIQGWSNLAQIVGSFAGYPNVPGYQGLVDTFSVSYGTTVNNDCTASPCGFLDQIGSAVTSITRSSAGSYVINTPKTYAKLFCTSDLWRSGANLIGTVGNVKIRCLSTNACSFSTEGVDTHGNLNCIGSY